MAALLSDFFSKIFSKSSMGPLCFIVSFLCGLAALYVYCPDLLMGHVLCISILLGFSIWAPWEYALFLLISSAVVTGLCGRGDNITSSVSLLWVLHGFFPGLFCAIHGKFLSRRKELPFLSLFSLFFSFTTLLALLQEDSYVFAETQHMAGLSFFVPGLLTLFFSFVCAVVFVTKMHYTKSVTPLHFRTTLWDYCWIIGSQCLFLFSFTEDRIFFGNMLLISFVPFVCEGVIALSQKNFPSKVHKTFFFLGVTLCGGPLIAALYALFAPWRTAYSFPSHKKTKRRKNHGNH